MPDIPTDRRPAGATGTVTMLLDRSWGVIVPGIPKPKGSKRCVGRRGTIAHTLVEQVNNTKWRRQVKAGGATLPPEIRGITGPLELRVTFTLPRPASHYDARGRLTAKAPAWPDQHGTGDVDKLARIIGDEWEIGKGGRGAGVMRNDAQICHIDVWKCYPDTPGNVPDQLDRPGALIRISPLTTAEVLPI